MQQGTNQGYTTPVSVLQVALNSCYSAGITVDGVFGPATRAALIKAQKSDGVVADGIFGPATREAMWFPVKGVGCHTMGWIRPNLTLL